MKTIKQHIFSNFNTIAILTLATMLPVLLLAIRLKITASFFMLFLVWNLFLAAIPYVISSYLKVASHLKNSTFFIIAGLWLLFLPNAPYIITDLVHLSHESSTSIIFDAIIISTFAISGVLFYLYSLKQMLHQLTERGFKKIKFAAEICIPFLTGYGIYLGRFERWNSWDLIQNPIQLFENILSPFYSLQKFTLVLSTTLLLGIFLFISYRVFNKLVEKPSLESN